MSEGGYIYVEWRLDEDESWEPAQMMLLAQSMVMRTMTEDESFEFWKVNFADVAAVDRLGPDDDVVTLEFRFHDGDSFQLRLTADWFENLIRRLSIALAAHRAGLAAEAAEAAEARARLLEGKGEPYLKLVSA